MIMPQPDGTPTEQECWANFWTAVAHTHAAIQIRKRVRATTPELPMPSVDEVMAGLTANGEFIATVNEWGQEKFRSVCRAAGRRLHRRIRTKEVYVETAGRGNRSVRVWLLDQE